MLKGYFLFVLYDVKGEDRQRTDIYVRMVSVMHRGAIVAVQTKDTRLFLKSKFLSHGVTCVV